MGAWGDESCSSDDCWDALARCGIKDIHDMKEDDAHSALVMFVTFSKEWNTRTKEIHLGMVTWILRHGLGVEHVHLRLARDHAHELRKDGAYMARWRDHAAREVQLGIEIHDIELAMRDLPEGQRGRVQAREVPGLLERLHAGGCENTDLANHSRCGNKLAERQITDARLADGTITDDPNLNGGTITATEEEMARACFLSIKGDSTELYFHDMKGDAMVTISRIDGTVTLAGTPDDCAKVFAAALEKLLRDKILKN